MIVSEENIDFLRKQYYAVADIKWRGDYHGLYLNIVSSQNIGIPP